MRGNVKVYQKKIVDRRRKRLFFLSLWALFFVGLVFSGLSYLSQMDALNIRSVTVEGISRLSSSSVVALADKHLEGNYGNFFSRRNIVLYPQNAIRADIAALPLVKSVEVNDRRQDSAVSLIIRIVERSEAALWCDEKGTGGRACFSVDENGLIFASATTTTGTIYEGKISDEGRIGVQVMPAEDFKNMQFFVRELAALDVEPTKVLVQDAGYMEISLAKGGKLIINESDNLSVVLSNLKTLISDTSVVPDQAAFLAGLDYIRLDSGNKVFFKLKNATTTKK